MYIEKLGVGRGERYGENGRKQLERNLIEETIVMLKKHL